MVKWIFRRGHGCSHGRCGAITAVAAPAAAAAAAAAAPAATAAAAAAAVAAAAAAAVAAAAAEESERTHLGGCGKKSLKFYIINNLYANPIFAFSYLQSLFCNLEIKLVI